MTDKMVPKGAAFDVEGTIINVEPAHHGAWLSAGREIGVDIATPEEAMEKVPNFSGGPDDMIIKQIYALLPRAPVPTEEQAKAFLQRKWHYYDILLDKIDLYPRPGFFEIYGRLRCMGMPVTLGTAVDLEKGLALLKRSGLDKLFSLSEIVLVTDVKNSKPAPDCFLETARRMRIDPHEQLVFEDSPRGVRSGAAAGSIVIGMPVYNTRTTAKRLYEAGARYVYPSWKTIKVEELFARLRK